MSSMDKATLTVHCPKCKKAVKKPLSWLQSKGRKCPACAADLPQVERAVQKKAVATVQKALASKLRSSGLRGIKFTK